MLNWKGCKRKWTWPTLRSYSSTCREREESRSLGGDLNPGVSVICTDAVSNSV
jgi:hypothetical protein